MLDKNDILVQVYELLQKIFAKLKEILEGMLKGDEAGEGEANG